MGPLVFSPLINNNVTIVIYYIINNLRLILVFKNALAKQKGDDRTAPYFRKMNVTFPLAPHQGKKRVLKGLLNFQSYF